MKQSMPRVLAIALILAMVISFLPAQARPVNALSTGVVISQVYGGGGNTGAPAATLKNDFIELYNRGAAPVDVTGWSVQYASATGTTWSGKTVLSGVIQAGQYYLIQEAAGTGGTVSLPTPNAIGSIAMAAGAGKVALVSNSTTLSVACPTGLVSVVDFVGYGTTANCYEGTGATGTLNNITAALRNSNGAAETDNNNADFTVEAPNPRNTPPPDLAPSVLSTVPANGAANVALNSNIIINFSEAVNVGGSWFSLSCVTSGAHAATASGGPTTFILDPGTDFVGGELCTLTVYAANVSDQDLNDPPDNMTVNFTAGFLTVAPPVAIHDIQGAGHFSPKNGQTVTTTPSIVTALRTTGSTRGFYLQDPNPDADPATSEGIFVFTGSSSSPAALVTVGDLIQISAKVSEFRSGGASGVGLALTELVAPFTITILSSGTPLPAPVILGTGGLIPPSTVIEDDASGSVESTGVFDPASDGIDFYESLEGMLVQVNDAVAVGPRSDFTSNREIPVIGDYGANAVVRTNRGGVIAQPGDFNPERIILNDWIGSAPFLPPANVGDTFPGAILGVMDYSFNNFKLQVISMPALVSGGLVQEVAVAAGLNQISVAAFNVENLAPTDPAGKFETLAELIIDHLQSPDILSIEEIQDNTGATDNGIVESSTTWNMLIAAIQAAGGPTYEYRQVDPLNNQDGGAPGGNIRVGFLFRTDRGLSFIDRPGAGSTTANAVVGSGAAAQLLYSPGRIDPANPAFITSRKPLAGEFMFNGHHLFVVANHWNSKGGDQPLFGVNQPPVFSSEIQRNQQATVVHDFVNAILAADPGANVLVMGDLNDFQFSSALATLKGSPAILTDLIETLPLAERYSYVFEGNSETLDHILASEALMARPYVYDVVHVNSEFANQVSDHEPQAMVITLNDPPTADAGGPYSVDEGSSVPLAATGSDLEGGALTYAWDLDNDGTFETPGQNVTFAGVDGPADQTVAVQVTDDGGLTAVASANVAVNNVAPTIVSVANDGPVDEGASSAITVTAMDSAGANDPLAYGFDCDNDLAFETITGSCAFADNGIYTVNVRVSDGDGGFASGATVVTVINVAPTAVFNSPASVDEGSEIMLSLTAPVDVPADLGSLQYAFDCGSGYGAFGGSNAASCPTVDNGTINVGGKVIDKDGGVSEYTAAVAINNVAPTVDIPVIPLEPSTEGSSVTTSATFSDPGVNDAPFICTVDYGDGSGALTGTVGGNTCTGPAHVYPTFGAYTVTVSVADKDGGIGSNAATHIVIFNWTGFFNPVDNPPAWNSANAGRAIPLKFSLGGSKGLNIFADAYPQSVQIACDTGDLLGDPEPTTNPGGSSLSYGGGKYNYVWKTDRAWAGTCRQLIITLTDGTVHVANFQFK